MGRLRDGYESPLFRGISSEVIELFGNEDGKLYRFSTDLSESTRDELWDEPKGRPSYEIFNMPFMLQDYSTPVDVGEYGQDTYYQATLWLARDHLDKVGVPKDTHGEQVRPGDIFECYFRGDRIFWSIIGADRRGFLNDTDFWTMLEMQIKRNDKFVPERYTG